MADFQWGGIQATDLPIGETIVVPAAGPGVETRCMNSFYVSNPDTIAHVILLKKVISGTDFFFARLDVSALSGVLAGINRFEGLAVIRGPNEDIRAASINAPSVEGPSITSSFGQSTSDLWQGSQTKILGLNVSNDLVPSPVAPKRSSLKSIEILNRDSFTHTFNLLFVKDGTIISFEQLTIANGTSDRWSGVLNLTDDDEKIEIRKINATATTDPECIANWGEE